MLYEISGYFNELIVFFVINFENDKREKNLFNIFFYLLHSDPTQKIILDPIILLYQPTIINEKIPIIHHLSTRQIRSPPSETPDKYHAIITIRKKNQITSYAPRRHKSNIEIFYITSTPI